ncbi:MAG: glucosidase, partial [Anaerolineae bacterium]|nr:glucosidase [Anaerolineae bacterium]
MPRMQTAEHQRLADAETGNADWRMWGAYLADRAWGTVREDYGVDGEPWRYFTHDQARSRAYRWNEDGIGGITNLYQNLCLAVAFWNERDPILKERFFGVTGPEGNHGEDVKELYFYLDATPTHSYLKMLYKYPQVPYPYEDLVTQNQRRGYEDPEYELTDALREALAERRLFDITIEWAKADEKDLLCRVTAVNRGPEPAPLHILPHLWARNTWAWGYDPARPDIHEVVPPHEGIAAVSANERHLDPYWWYVRSPGAERPELLFTENDTNHERLFGSRNETAYVKDAFHRAIVDGESSRVNPDHRGTKAAAHVSQTIPAGERLVVEVRFSPRALDRPFDNFDAVFEQRIAEADDFYAATHHPHLDEDARRIQREAWAGLVWTEQFYHYSVELWLDGDPAQPAPPPSRRNGRNADWRTHIYNLEVISMPDKWEYPWYAAWDLAFHAVPIAMIDPGFAKHQLRLLLREWYMHPNGQIPAYEWDFSDVNPPVHAWAAWRVYQISHAVTGEADTVFLEQIFHKLLLNFTWWVNRKDHDDNNVFQGGFLGLDNIGVFDRSKPLPTGGHIDQADGTAWMGMYSLHMLRIALELARTNPAYEDVATKFFEHFIYISYALAHMGREGGHDVGIWNAEDGFYYDVLHMPNGHIVSLRVRSLV